MKPNASSASWNKSHISNRPQIVRIEEYARDMIAVETAHQDEVNKMLRKPGQTELFVA